MGSEWTPTTLASVLSFSNGKSSPDRADGLPYPVYGSNGVIGFAQGANADPDTIVIGRVGSYCGSLYFSTKKCWVTDNAIRANALGDNDARFLLYLLQTLDLNQWRAGSGQPLLNQTILGAIPASVPEPKEQRAIAHILGTLDDKIELNERMNETLEAIARAIFKSWFVDFDPVRAKAEGREPPGMDAETVALFPDAFEDSITERLPKGWRTGAVAELADLSRDALYPTDFPSETFAHFSIPAFDEGRVPTVETGDQIKSNKFVVFPDSVLLSKLNPRFPRVWLPLVDRPQRAICSTEFLVALPKRPATRSYLYALFSSGHFLDRFATLVTGTSASHQRVKPSDLLSMSVVVPTAAAVERFTSIANPLYLRTQAALKESLALAALRDALLPRLLSGQLRVKYAEKLVEADA